jgi:hypothetical protein
MDSNTLYYIIAAIAAFIIIRRKFMSASVQQYSATEAKQKIESGGILLDVRTLGERQNSSIYGSLHIGKQKFDCRISIK